MSSPAEGTHSQTFAERLAAFSTCDVSDALQQLGHVHGGFLAGPVLYSPQFQAGDTRIAGPAYTVKYARVSDAVRTRHEGVKEGHYIDGVPSGSVIVVSAPDGVHNAVYGSLMSTRAKAKGAVGTVVDGRVRDLEEHRKLLYPVFAGGVGTASPYGEVVVKQVNGNVQIGSGAYRMTVEAGDYILGDSNGVVCVPVQLLSKVLELMSVSVVADARIAQDLKNGVSFAAARAKHRV